MTNNTATPPQIFSHERYCYKEPFSLKEGFHRFVELFSDNGIIIHVDPSKKEACACFDNSKDRDYFRKEIELYKPLRYQIPFDATGRQSLILYLSKKGIVITVDQTRTKACAYFSNENDAKRLERIVSRRKVAA